jgi:hypothetical protein
MMGTHHRIVRKIKAADEPSDVSGIPLIVIPPDFCTLALLHDSSQSLALRVQVKAQLFFSSVRKAGLCLSFRSRRPSLPQRTKPPCLTNAPHLGRYFRIQGALGFFLANFCVHILVLLLLSLFVTHSK